MSDAEILERAIERLDDLSSHDDLESWRASRFYVIAGGEPHDPDEIVAQFGNMVTAELVAMVVRATPTIAAIMRITLDTPLVTLSGIPAFDPRVVALARALAQEPDGRGSDDA